MRELATRTSTSPMAAYHHVADREELLRLVVEAIGASLDLSGGGEGWDGRLRHWAREVRRALSEYPGTARWLLVNPPAGPSALVIAESALTVLLEAGLDDAGAAAAYATLTTWVLCRCDLEDQWRMSIGDPGGALRMTRFLQAVEGSGADRFPVARRLAPQLASLDPDRMFDAGLDLVLAGIAAGLLPD